jgi:hypothetical protein
MAALEKTARVQAPDFRYQKGKFVRRANCSAEIDFADKRAAFCASQEQRFG